MSRVLIFFASFGFAGSGSLALDGYAEMVAESLMVCGFLTSPLPLSRPPPLRVSLGLGPQCRAT